MTSKKKIVNPAHYKAEFLKVFTQLTLKHTFAEVWADFTELAAIAIHQSVYFNPAWMPQGQGLEEKMLPIDETFTKLEDRYKAIAPKYGSEGMALMSKLYVIAEKAVREHRIDFLGPLYEELDMGGSAQRGSRGEFFTPAAISQMMAQITLIDVDKILAEKGFLTLQEPAVGPGGMVIAVANQLAALGHNPHEELFVEAIDVNRTLFHVAYFQISAMDIPGRIWCGNTLTLEMQEWRETPHYKLSRYVWEKDPCFQMLKFIREMDVQVADGENCESENTEALEGEESADPSMPVIDDKYGQLRLF